MIYDSFGGDDGDDGDDGDGDGGGDDGDDVVCMYVLGTVI